MKTFLSLVVGCCIWNACAAQDAIQASDYPAQDLHVAIKYDGKPLVVKTWDDANGANYLIVSRTNDYERLIKEVNETGTNSELYINHYVLTDAGDVKLLRKIYDFVHECQLDLTLDFVKKSLTITDLDDDDIAEASFVYRLACRSDVSGSEQKLIMIENGEKYAIRGNASVIFGYEDDGREMRQQSEYKVGAEFKKAPAAFEKAALRLWKQFELETFEEE